MLDKYKLLNMSSSENKDIIIISMTTCVRSSISNRDIRAMEQTSSKFIAAHSSDTCRLRRLVSLGRKARHGDILNAKCEMRNVRCDLVIWR